MSKILLKLGILVVLLATSFQTNLKAEDIVPAGSKVIANIPTNQVPYYLGFTPVKYDGKMYVLLGNLQPTQLASFEIDGSNYSVQALSSTQDVGYTYYYHYTNNIENDGYIYGTSSYGLNPNGFGIGHIYRVNIETRALESVFRFTSTTGETKSNLVAIDGYLYTTLRNTIIKINLDTKVSEVILDFSSDGQEPRAFHYLNGKFYFAIPGTNSFKMASCDIDGSNYEVLQTVTGYTLTEQVSTQNSEHVIIKTLQSNSTVYWGYNVYNDEFVELARVNQNQTNTTNPLVVLDNYFVYGTVANQWIMTDLSNGNVNNFPTNNALQMGWFTTNGNAIYQVEASIYDLNFQYRVVNNPAIRMWGFGNEYQTNKPKVTEENITFGMQINTMLFEPTGDFGFVVSTNPMPTLNSAQVTSYEVTLNGEMKVSIHVDAADFHPDSMYFIRAFNTNGNNTVYFNEFKFQSSVLDQNASFIGLNKLGSTSTTLVWKSGTGEGRLVLLKAGEELTEVPEDGMLYQEGDMIGDAQVVSVGDFVGVTVDGLEPNELYSVRAFEYFSVDDSYLTSSEVLNPRMFRTIDESPLTEVTVVDKGENFIHMGWEASEEVDGYIVSLASDPDFSWNGSLAEYLELEVADNNFYMYGGLPKNSTFYFRVRSYKDGVLGDWVYYGTKDMPTAIRTTPNPPRVPSNVAFTNRTATTLTYNVTNSPNTSGVLVLYNSSNEFGTPEDAMTYNSAQNMSTAVEAFDEGQGFARLSTNNNSITRSANTGIPDTVYFRFYSYVGSGEFTVYSEEYLEATHVFIKDQSSVATAPTPQFQISSPAEGTIVLNWNQEFNRSTVLVGNSTANPIIANGLDYEVDDAVTNGRVAFIGENGQNSATITTDAGMQKRVNIFRTEGELYEAATGFTGIEGNFLQQFLSGPIVWTLSAQPKTPKVKINEISRTTSSITLQLTLESGNDAQRFLVAYGGEGYSWMPTNGMQYSANAMAGNGTVYGVYTSAQFPVTVTLTGRQAESVWNFHVFGYNQGSNVATINYNPNPVSLETITLANEPTDIVAIMTDDITTSSVVVNFSSEIMYNAGLLLISEGTEHADMPLNGKCYPAQAETTMGYYSMDMYGEGQYQSIAYNAIDGSSVTIDQLEPGTTYTLTMFTHRGRCLKADVGANNYAVNYDYLTFTTLEVPRATSLSLNLIDNNVESGTDFRAEVILLDQFGDAFEAPENVDLDLYIGTENVGSGEMMEGYSSTTITGNYVYQQGGMFTVSTMNSAGVTNANAYLTIKAVTPDPVTNLALDNSTAGQIAASWTNTGAGALVVVQRASSVDFTANDGQTYTAQTYSNSSNAEVVLVGTGNSVTITGLTRRSRYTFSVFAFNGQADGTRYSTATSTGVRANKVAGEDDFDVDFGTSFSVQPVYPNPATSVINFSLSNDDNGVIDAQLIDAAGRTLANWGNIGKGKSGAFNVSLTLPNDIANGSYFLLLQKNEETGLLEVKVQK